MCNTRAEDVNGSELSGPSHYIITTTRAREFIYEQAVFLGWVNDTRTASITDVRTLRKGRCNGLAASVQRACLVSSMSTTKAISTAVCRHRRSPCEDADPRAIFDRRM